MSDGKDVEKAKRVQFAFSEDALRRLNEIVEKTGCSNKAEAVAEGLQIYEFLVDHPGVPIILKDGKITEA